MIAWSTLVTLLGLFLTGHAVLGLLRPTRPRGPLELHATAILIGMASLAVLVVAVLWMLGPLSPTGGRVLLALAAAPGLAFLPLNLKRIPRPENVDPLTAGQWAFAGLIFLVAAFLVFYPSSMPMHVFDSIYHFAYKGKLLFHEGFGTDAWLDMSGTVTGEGDERHLGRIITHPNYPPGIPALEALVGWVHGSYQEDYYKPLVAFFVLCPAAWLWAVLRPRGNWPALLGAFTWMSLPILFYNRTPHDDLMLAWRGLLYGMDWLHDRFPNVRFYLPDGWTMDGATDLPQGAFFFGAFVFLWRTLPRARLAWDRADWIGAGVLLAGALLTKNEGLGLMGCLGLGFFLAVAANRVFGGPESGFAAPLVRLGAVILLGLVLAGPWLVVRREIPRIDENYDEILRPSYILENQDRVRIVAQYGFGKTFLGIRVDKKTWEATLRARRQARRDAQGGRNADRPRFSDSTNELEAELAEDATVDGLEGGLFPPGKLTSRSLLIWNLLWPLWFGTLGWSLLRPRRFLAHPALATALVFFGGCSMYFLILVVTPWNLFHLFGTEIPDRLVLHVAPIAILGTFTLLWRTPEEAGLSEEPSPAPDPPRPPTGEPLQSEEQGPLP